MLEEIAAHELAGIDVGDEKLGQNRQIEVEYISEEVNIVKEYIVAFDEGLATIKDDSEERMKLDTKND